jgi:hypothetical protein
MSRETQSHLKRRAHEGLIEKVARGIAVSRGFDPDARVSRQNGPPVVIGGIQYVYDGAIGEPIPLWRLFIIESEIALAHAIEAIDTALVVAL